MQHQELEHLERCIALAREALESGDDPFGSVLVSGDGQVLCEARNRVVSGDATQHPELALAQWAAVHLSIEARAQATVYTSGEHCPMCAAAHAWARLGRIVFISSSRQLGEWLVEFGAKASPVSMLSIPEVAPDVVVEGPVTVLVDAVRELHQLRHAGA
ncbi:nucleoside deaminase [Kushneria marisflavi]|uniref:tRNA-specific adenosine deaminase n=1 Tax=Kushneria marisflavi TaxID=157779 RepID=A0A240UL78_9GAMM|nr:nucleoside deaminase [Kushneria marisflavi]ART62251.1 tRNA-specific adenosine deaminase [Kushneria marisflavi]RKD87345.1 tRNA(Arg) A34 adenosine deaminase TadA [Kushneria marisflavi]